MDVISLSTSLSGMTAARLQMEVQTSVLGKALDAETQATMALFDARSMSEPAGLTFSPSGLSPGRTSRFVADL